MSGITLRNFINFNAELRGSVKQFTTYLMETTKVTSMDKIEYWFDKEKLNNNTDTTPIKEKFKQMMYNGTELTNNGTPVFNVIWGDVGLRGKLFPDNISEQEKDDAQFEFKQITSNINNSFYNFIKIK